MADELYCWSVAPGAELKHTQYQVTIDSALNAVEAGKLPNTIQESCPLRLDDWFSFSTDRQAGRQSVAALTALTNGQPQFCTAPPDHTALESHPHALAFRTSNKSHWSHRLPFALILLKCNSALRPNVQFSPANDLSDST